MFFKPSPGRKAHFRWLPLRGGCAGRQQVGTAARRGSQLLLPNGGGATSGVCQLSAEPRHELGGVPQQWLGVRLRAGVSQNTEALIDCSEEKQTRRLLSTEDYKELCIEEHSDRESFLVNFEGLSGKLFFEAFNKTFLLLARV